MPLRRDLGASSRILRVQGRYAVRSCATRDSCATFTHLWYADKWVLG